VRGWLVVVLVTSASFVHAEPRPGPLVLDDGEVAIDLVTEVSLEKEHLADPVSIAPDLWWGVLPQLTIGLIHSDASVDQIGAGATLCVRHSDLFCGKTYRGSGLDVRWSALAGDFAIAPRIRAEIRDLDPLLPAVTVGALVRWSHGAFAITSDPYLRLGLENQARGNRSALFVPVWLSEQLGYRVELAVHTGFDSELDVIRDGYHIPMALIARVKLSAHFDIGVEGGFSTLIGAQNDSSFRAILFTLGWRQY
jgi:hypothetical protein